MGCSFTSGLTAAPIGRGAFIHGKAMRDMRERADVWTSGQPRSQFDQPEMESEPAACASPCWQDTEADARMHALHPQRTSAQARLSPSFYGDSRSPVEAGLFLLMPT